MKGLLLADPDAQAEIHGHAESNGPWATTSPLSPKRLTRCRLLWPMETQTRFTIYAPRREKTRRLQCHPHGRAKNRR
ncbi:MAG: hypothetical protein IPN19_14485 [Elusimicrobia bacterium]|nr:hypothetical protein [Elusimicrobiota bacterium]